MSKEAMKLALEHAKRDERHLNHAETRYWCRMYRDIAEKAVEALAKPDFWEGYVPEPVKPAQCKYPKCSYPCTDLPDCRDAEQPAQQEPVAWMNPNGGMLTANYINNFASGLDKEIHNIPLYTLPPAQRTWVGLVWGELPEDGQNHDFLRGAVWAETKLKEKNQ